MDEPNETTSRVPGAPPEFYIDGPESLSRFLQAVDGTGELRACAIDTEADSMHSYETKLCLIQFAVPGALAIIDPLAFGDGMLDPFLRYIDRFEVVWMHGADYDISLLNTTYSWVPSTIYDTQIAARLLGAEKFGLANLLETEYDVKLSKQSQKADWSKRPLTGKMLEYAYNDVRFLLDLGDRYLDRLRGNDRIGWFVESCRAAQDSVLNRSGKSVDDLWRINGWGRLSPKGLHFLKYLWLWRDDECRRLDRPAFKFLGNQDLLNLAVLLEGDKTVVPPHYLRPGPVRRLHEAISSARAVGTGEYPVKHRRGDGPRLEIDEARLDRIRRFRDARAQELGVEPTVIATRFAMERLSATNLPDEEKDTLLAWQRELLLPCL
ncbi:MAG: ribonuclease D [Verrucomicrobiae bacterium]|nr:ribonuclease D [Verrucomicrobiae bacterium]